MYFSVIFNTIREHRSNKRKNTYQIIMTLWFSFWAKWSCNTQRNWKHVVLWDNVYVTYTVQVQMEQPSNYLTVKTYQVITSELIMTNTCRLNIKIQGFFQVPMKKSSVFKEFQALKEKSQNSRNSRPWKENPKIQGISGLERKIRKFKEFQSLKEKSQNSRNSRSWKKNPQNSRNSRP